MTIEQTTTPRPILSISSEVHRLFLVETPSEERQQQSDKYTPIPSSPNTWAFYALRMNSFKEPLQIPRNKVFGIVGRSGSGKTTLLNQIAMLDYPTAKDKGLFGGDITYHPSDTSKPDSLYSRMNEKQRADFRTQRLAIMFQTTSLFDFLTASENVMLPLRLQGLSPEEQNKRAKERLQEVDLHFETYHSRYPVKLSGGEAHRVAMARALAGEPELLLADEPTADLDVHSARIVMKALTNYAKKGGTVILSIHNLRDAVSYCHHILSLHDGKPVRLHDLDGKTSEERDAIQRALEHEIDGNSLA